MKIKVNHKYIVKVGKNEVEVTIVEQTEKGYKVQTATGKIIAVNAPERFIREVPAKPEKPQKKMSMLAAAIEILRRTGEPMNSKELIAAMAEADLWNSTKGKTPQCTLHAALSKELKSNPAVPFRKSIIRGKFRIIKPIQN